MNSLSIDEEEYWDCVESYKKEQISNWMGDFGVDRREAIESLKEKDWIWDYEQILEQLKDGYYQFFDADEFEKVQKAKKIVRNHFPDVYEYIDDSMYVVYCEEERLEARAVFTPQGDPRSEEGVDKYAIFIDMGVVEEARINQLTATLAHEAMHLDARINPTKYGLSEGGPGQWMESLFGMDEKKINEKIEEAGLPRELELKWHRGILLITISSVVLKLVACMKGKDTPEDYG